MYASIVKNPFDMILARIRRNDSNLAFEVKMECQRPNWPIHVCNKYQSVKSIHVFRTYTFCTCTCIPRSIMLHHVYATTCVLVALLTKHMYIKFEFGKSECLFYQAKTNNTYSS